MNTRNAYLQGYHGYHTGARANSNPYPPTVPQYAAWVNGRRDARRDAR